MGQWAKYPDIRFLGDDDQENTGTSEIVGFQLGLRNGSIVGDDFYGSQRWLGKSFVLGK